MTIFAHEHEIVTHFSHRLSTEDKEALGVFVDEAVKAEREACAKAVCVRCAGDWPLDLETGEHHAPEGGHILLPDGRCEAIAIRARS